MDERSDIGVIGYSHNARIVQIKRFIAFPPKSLEAVCLRLAPLGEGGEILAEYSRDECVKDAGRTIPEAVSLALEEHAETLAQEVEAVLAWCRADGTTYTTKRLKTRPRRGEVARIPGMTLEETAAIVGNGDAQAMVGHVIRSQEIYLRSYLQGHHTTLQEQREVNQTSMELAKMSGAMTLETFAKNMELMALVGKYQGEAIMLRAENDELKRQLAQLTGEESTADMTASDEARAELIRQVTNGAVQVAPEAWSMLKTWAIAQAQAHVAAQKTAASNGHVNGSNGHVGAAE